MGPLKDLGGLSQKLQKLAKASKAENLDQTGKKSDSPAEGVNSPRDRTTISNTAQQLLSQHEAATELLKKLDSPDSNLTPDELSEIRARISDPDYLGSEMVDKIADKLIDELPRLNRRS